MGRFLDIEYVFDLESREVPDRTSEAAMLADLSPELLQELWATTLVLNREAVLEVIERIAHQAPEAAPGLRNLVDNYQMVELRDLLGEVKGKIING